MKLLFVSSLYSLDLKPYLASTCKGGTTLLNQVDAFQWAMLEGLVENKSDFEVVSFPALGTYPKHFKKFYVPQSEIVYCGKKYGVSMKYSTLIAYKEWDIQRRLKKYVKKWIDTLDNVSDEPLVVLVYTSTAMFVKPLASLKHNYPNLHICCVITDLIDDAMNFDSNRTFLKRIQIAREKKQQKRLYSDIDFFVLLSKAMEERIPEAKGRNIVIEGIYSKYELPKSSKERGEDGLKIVLYGGTLQEFSGIKDLVDAFMLLKNQDYQLVICGSGFCKSYIKECVQKDSRIDYLGVISRKELLLLQRKATLLVNPRKPTEEITRYSFPSKTIEYLSSGTPMLGYKLEGIPEEYYQHYYTIDKPTVQGLADKLEEVLSLSDEERKQMATEAQYFVLQNKTAECQMRRLLDFLKLKLN